MSHDPLCPVSKFPEEYPRCACNLIVEAREDERANITAEFMSNHGDRWEYEAGVAAGRAEALGIRVRQVMPYANGYFDGEDHMLARAVSVVDALSHGDPCDCAECRVLVMALTALRALEEKP